MSRRDPSEAVYLFRVRRFAILLCPTWWFGWKTHRVIGEATYLTICIIPAIGLRFTL